MNLDNLRKTAYTDRLVITGNVVIHFIPDFGSDLSLGVQKLPIRTNNLRSIVIDPEILKFGSARYNPLDYIKELKEKMIANEEIENHSVIKTFPPLSGNKYLLVDHSLVSSGIERVINFTTMMQISNYLFKIIEMKINKFKEYYPDSDHIVLFGINKLNGIIKVLETIYKKSRKELNEKFSVFDKFVLIGTFHEKTIVFPYMGYKEEDVVEVYKQNLNKIESIIESINFNPNIKIDTKSERKRVEEKVRNDEKVSQIASDSIQNVKTQSIQNEDEVIKKLKVDTKELNNILKKYEIKDSVIIANVKIATENYIQNNHNNINKEELEEIILKAINTSVYGTDELSDEVKNNPNILFKKLAQVNIYTKKINMPKFDKVNDNYINNPSVINLNEVTGPVRHEFEFDENIDESVKTLIKSLETSEKPIKVLDIKTKVKDNNLDRYRLYKVTLQNMAGGETEPYEVQFKIPALVNDKYFKLNGINYFCHYSMNC